MDNEVRILKSYSKVWKIERMFYQVGGFNLPNPVALNTLLYFAGFAALIFLARNFPLVSLIPGFYKYIAIPGVLAWACNNKLLDGKNPLAFIISIIKHYVVINSYGKRINRYKFVKNSGKAKYANKISYRVVEKI